MNVYVPIKTLIAANVTANSLLSGRVYARILPDQPTYPAAVVTLTGVGNTNSKTTASTLDFPRVQVDIYGTTMASVGSTAAAIRAALDYQTSGSLQHIEFAGMSDGFTENPELFRVITEYEIAYQ